MLTIDGLSFFDQSALIDRLTSGVQEAGKEIVFVVGAALTAPTATTAGVADVSAITEMIRDVFSGKQAQLDELDRLLLNSENRYQAAFRFLQGRRGQDGANRIIRQAVWRARLSAPVASDKLTKIPEDELRQIDEDTQSWSLSPGVEALGELITLRPSEFGRHC